MSQQSLIQQLPLRQNIVQDIFDVWENKLHSTIHIKDIEDLDYKTICYIRHKFSPILHYLEYGNVLEWLHNGIRSYYAAIILFTLFSRCIYHNTRHIYKNDYKIFLFMEMGLQLYTITCSDTQLNNSDSFPKNYIILLPFQLLEEILYQRQGRRIIYNFLIHEKNIIYKQLLRKVLYYQKERIKVLELFKRFPIRNQVLNREPTITEIDYLDEQEFLYLK